MRPAPGTNPPTTLSPCKAEDILALARVLGRLAARMDAANATSPLHQQNPSPLVILTQKEAPDAR
jgi:hypothetical protein